MPTGQLVLIVDDEPDLTDLLAYNLKREGFRTLTAHNGQDAIAMALSDKPDLIVLDIMMPPPNGLEVAKRIRANPEISSTPIILLTAKSSEHDELAGLTVGADDYITKPFSPRLLIARIAALLRRSNTEPSNASAGTPPTPPALLCAGPISIDPESHEVRVDGSLVQLTLTEFRILAALVAQQSRVLSRASLISRAMGPGVTVTERTVDVHITSIRKKLGSHAGMLQTVRGVGYRLNEPESSSK